MRNALLYSLFLLPGFIFSTTSLAGDNPLDQDLSLQLDYQLSQDSPLRSDPQPVQDLPLRPDPQPDPDISFRPGYQLGQGWRRGNYSFSGYASVMIDAPTGGSAAVNLDDLSLFVGGHINKWANPFLEAEISEHTIIQQGGGARGNGYIVIERLYNDSMLLEHDTLRIGKILAPVGNWNMIHAAPLVSINTRPLTTFQGFSKYASGMSWLHDPENGVTPDWQLYWQPGSEIPRRPKDLAPRNYRNILGGHINMPLSLVDKVGASLQHGKLTETGESFMLYGLNINKSFGRLRVESEAISSRWSGGVAPRAHDNESGIFGLVDYTMTSRWHGILEWEHYQDHEVNLPSRNILAGISYKFSPIVWKLEYVRQMGVSPYIPSGWLASFSTLF